jgi:protein-disulfide isomerase/uncharacterized membrane protein
MGVMTTPKSQPFFLFTLFLGFIGAILSFLLIREFYGTSGDFVNSLCSVSGGDNGCEKIAQSEYSGFRNIPFTGDIPIALFGFAYYGVIMGISYFGIKGTSENGDGYLSLILLLSIFGLAIDLVLFSIMVLVVKVICPLCISTYAVTLLLIVKSYREVQSKGGSKMIDFLKTNIPFNIKSNILNYFIIVLFFLTCGIGGGKFQFGQGSATKLGEEGDRSTIQKKIDAYEKSPLLALETKGIPFIGDEKAPITIVKYADFNCGHCMHTSFLLRQILQEYAGLVKVYYKNFPLDGNCNQLVTRKSPDGSSCIAASASICGAQQNKFKAVYEDLYSDTEKGIRHSTLSVIDIAKKANVSLPGFNTCMASKEVVEAINRDVEEARILDIKSTPSLFINNRAIDPGTPDPVFLRALLSNLTKKL